MPETPKTVSILIDGYNLLFQGGLEGKSRGAGWLERARARLVKLLLQSLPKEDIERTQIVFDANDQSVAARQAQSSAMDFHVTGTKHCIELVPVSSSTESKAPGPRPIITFANEHDEADDLIEEIIRKHPHPKSLQVVSSDNRIRKCARARRAISVDSESFLDQLQEPREQPRSTNLEETEMPTEISDDEVGYWMKEFGAD